jgi:hypothetical protein
MDSAREQGTVGAAVHASCRMAVGRSADSDAATAARDALASACRDVEPKLLLVFAAPSYDLSAIAATLREAAPDAAIAGCATGGEISIDGASDDSLVIAALGGDGITISTSAVRVAGCLRDAASSAAACIGDVADREHRALILLSDGASGDPREVVRGAYSVAGAAVPLVGGCVRPRGRASVACQIHDGEALAGVVVAVAIGSDTPLGVGVSHGWTPLGGPLFVSRTLGTSILSLDDEPALDAYLARIGVPADECTDAATFSALALQHPLGVSRTAGSEHVRHVSSADFALRSLHVQVPIPPGSQAWVMDGDCASVLGATDDACAQAIAALGGHEPSGLIVFDCVARRRVLGDATRDEIARIAAHAGAGAVAGLYTFGEIARRTGVTGFHNQALAVLALG